MDLRRATKQNLTDFFRFLARSPATDYWEVDGIARWRTPLAHPWFNGMLLRRPPQSGDAEHIARLMAAFAEPAPHPFTLWIEWDVPRAPWQPLLSSIGFVHDPGAPGMALELAQLPEEPALYPGFTVETVTTNAGPNSLRTWTDIFIEAYELPADWADGLYALVEGLGTAHPLAFYLGILDGEPVATTSTFDSAGVIGVQFVATLPSARRRGLGSMMTLFPLYAARSRGQTAAVLQSSAMGYSVYKDLGFRHIVNVDNEYLPTPPLPPI